MPMQLKTPEELADMLLERGITSSQGLTRQELRMEMTKRLAYINFYRIYPYFISLTQEGDLSQMPDSAGIFRPGTCWEDIWKAYMFDRKLRGVLMDAISRIEVALRAQIVECWGDYSGDAYPHLNLRTYRASFLRKKNPNEDSSSEWKHFCATVEKYFKRNKAAHCEVHVELRKAQTLADLPVWALVEFTTLGNLETLLCYGLKKNLVLRIAQNMGFKRADTFTSAISLLTRVRNACAHQSRVWNRYWLTGQSTPILRNVDKEFADVSRLDRIGAALTICQQLLLTIAPQSEWKDRLVELLHSELSPTTHIHKILGFLTPEWHRSPIWVAPQS